MFCSIALILRFEGLSSEKTDFPELSESMIPSLKSGVKSDSSFEN
jgi:hypothetical protein